MAAVNGSLIFVGLRSGKTYSVDVYLSDTANALANFDAGAGASSTSPTETWFEEPVALVDAAFASGLAAVTKLRVIANGNPTRDVIRVAAHLESLNNRPRLAIKFRAGTRISLLQLA